MPVIAAIIWGAFLRVIGSAVGQVLIALGIGLVTYGGVSVSLDFMKNSAASALQSLPPQLGGLFGLMKVGECISIISSAVVMKFTLMGLKNGAMSKWGRK